MGAEFGRWTRSKCWMRSGGGSSSRGARGTDVASICLCSETGRPMRLPIHGAAFVGQLDQHEWVVRSRLQRNEFSDFHSLAGRRGILSRHGATYFGLPPEPSPAAWSPLWPRHSGCSMPRPTPLNERKCSKVVRVRTFRCHPPTHSGSIHKTKMESVLDCHSTCLS